MVRLADDRIDHVGRRYVGGVRGGGVSNAGPGDHADQRHNQKHKQHRRGTDTPQVPRRVQQPQHHCSNKPKTADQKMNIGRDREQQRGDGQSFRYQHKPQRGQHQDVSGHLGLVAAEHPFAADDALAEQRHDHDRQCRVQRCQFDDREQRRQHKRIGRHRQQPGDDLGRSVADRRHQRAECRIAQHPVRRRIEYRGLLRPGAAVE